MQAFFAERIQVSNGASQRATPMVQPPLSAAAPSALLAPNSHTTLLLVYRLPQP
ncbi:MAG: hypothetical protein HC925_06240 [Coleofasciculaceae cyanobacterium SM2_3_26]|nr:hypothetical protein [Coleofasciculaceae cyanobacterium SM2_3_26]